MPAVRLGNEHGPLWTIGLACQMGGRNSVSCSRNSGERTNAGLTGLGYQTVPDYYVPCPATCLDHVHCHVYGNIRSPLWSTFRVTPGLIGRSARCILSLSKIGFPGSRFVHHPRMCCCESFRQRQ
jgi:hypothetical protein